MLIWEITTRGLVPYGTLFKPQYILDGIKQPRPLGCEAEIGKLMLECWQMGKEGTVLLQGLVMGWQVLESFGKLGK